MAQGINEIEEEKNEMHTWKQITEKIKLNSLVNFILSTSRAVESQSDTNTVDQMMSGNEDVRESVSQTSAISPVGLISILKLFLSTNSDIMIY